MFERFTSSALRVVALAEQEARQLNHSSVAPEHLVLGLAAEAQGVAAQLLRASRISLEGLRDQLKTLRAPEPLLPESSDVGLTPDAWALLESSVAAAYRRGRDYVGTEDLLFALLAKPSETVAGRMLSQLASSEEFRLRVVHLQAEPPSPEQPADMKTTRGDVTGPARGEPERDEGTLERFLEKVRGTKALPAEEEQTLLAGARAGDEGAFRRVVESYLERTALLATKLAPPGIREMDAIQEGILALAAVIRDPSVADPEAALSGAIRTALQGRTGTDPT